MSVVIFLRPWQPELLHTVLILEQNFVPASQASRTAMHLQSEGLAPAIKPTLKHTYLCGLSYTDDAITTVGLHISCKISSSFNVQTLSLEALAALSSSCSLLGTCANRAVIVSRTRAIQETLNMNEVEFAIPHSVHRTMIASQGYFRVNERCPVQEGKYKKKKKDLTSCCQPIPG